MQPKKKNPRNLLNYKGFLDMTEIGTRILGISEGTTDFEYVPLGHSGISPTAGRWETPQKP